MKRLILGGFLLLFLTSSAFGQTDSLTVGSLNLEWFGHGNNPRSSEQIKMLAEYIQSLQVDILAVQEVHPTGNANGNLTYDVNELQMYLGPDYNMKFGASGRGQHVGFIYDMRRIRIWDFGEVRGIQREQAEDGRQSFPRIPLSIFVIPRSGGPDFRLLTVHSYFGSDAARFREAEQLAEWTQNYLSEGDDRDLAIIGDFNTKSMDGQQPQPSQSQTIKNLESLGSPISISKNHDEFTTPTTGERYDQGFLSPDLFHGEYVSGSWDVVRGYCGEQPDEYRLNISNHCPVLFKIAGEDNDNDTIGNWGK